MQSSPENEQLMEEELESEFTKKGGKILKVKKNGAPQKWLCAINDNGEPFDPPGVDLKNIQRNINNEGKWEGSNPSEEDRNERKYWDSGWNDPDPKGRGQT